MHDDEVGSDPKVTLEAWRGPWSDDDPDANFKADVALHAELDPLATIEALSATVGVPAGAICRYVLAKWASEGSAALLEIGPRMVATLWSAVERAEEAGTDAARLTAYAELRDRLAWLRVPLSDD